MRPGVAQVRPRISQIIDDLFASLSARNYSLKWPERLTLSLFGISVDDVSFFQNVTPVRFGHLPSLQDSVTVVGYPIGGVAISVTQGVVSRIEVTAYSHGSSELLGLQIDAAINSGNSGGPAKWPERLTLSLFGISVDDVSFFQNVTPVRFGHLPSLQDSVTVVGYPIGGVAISVTQGVVSRIEVTAYSHGSSELLGLQIDAAINSGNSGGPAFNKDGECVGVAFQSLKHEDAENIGYVIPSPVIVHFLQDYARNGKYTGFPTLGVEWQKLENPDMRKFLKMRSLNERTEHGVYVRRVSPTSPAGALIQTTDVLLSFDGVPIARTCASF